MTASNRVNDQVFWSVVACDCDVIVVCMPPVTRRPMDREKLIVVTSWLASYWPEAYANRAVASYGRNRWSDIASIMFLWPCLISKRFLPARRYASAGYRDRNVSVRLSVTRRYCVKTKKVSGMISSPSGSPKTLVFWRQISSPNSKGFPPNGGLKQGSVGKIQRFLAVFANIPSAHLNRT